jgi:VWFA-related protein
MLHHNKRIRSAAVVAGLIWLAVVTFNSPEAWGQSINQLTINYIEAANLPGQFVNQVRAYVTVSSADQLPISGLSPENFEALEDGKQVAVDTVNQAMDPMAVILVIDTSGSMQARGSSGQTAMDAAKNAAIDFTATLSDEDRLAIYSFNREPVLEMDFSTDREQAILTLNNVAAKTKAPTCLYDTAYQAVKKAAEIPMGRRAIILLTDGRDEMSGDGGPCSTYSTNDVIDAATTKTIRVPIYTVGVGPKVDPQDLGRMSKLTGGRNLIARSISELHDFYQIIANQLKNQYVITYTSQTPSGEHSLVLKVSSEGQKRQDEKRFWMPPLPVLPPPQVRFDSPAASSEIKAGETVTVRVSITPEDTVARVRYYVDATLREEFSQMPFNTFEWNTEGLQAGRHIVRVEAIDIKGQNGYAEISQMVKGPPPMEPRPLGDDEPAPVAEASSPSPPVSAIAAISVLLVIAVGGALWLKQRKKKIAAEAVAQLRETELSRDIEDETMFAADFGKSASAPPATLSVVESMVLDAGTTFELQGRVTVGRTDRNDVNIPDKSVSRKHGEIYFEDNAYYIRDLGSRNGLRVDQKRVSMDGTPLRDGAKIWMSPKTILKFHCHALAEKVGFDDKTKRYDM